MANEILSPNYILPDNDVWLLKGVPLENNYENTILWQVGIGIDASTISQESVEQAKERQFNYFTATVGQDTRYHHLRLPAMTYLREGRRYLRVDLPYTRAIQYNYLIFKNNGAYTIGESTTAYHYEHRYYYAFITSFEYINDKTTLIHYEIDLMQTYNFDYQLMQCFVEREHSITDVIGENTISENLPVGEYLYYFKNDVPQLRTWSIAITGTYAKVYNSQTQEWEAREALGSINGNLYSGLYTTICATASAANDYINFMASKAKIDSIEYITMVPTYFGSGYDSATIPSVTWTLYKSGVNSITNDTDWTYNFNGKTGPRNKKLYCYPYNKLVINNNCGDINEYEYELFTGDYTNFEIVGTIMGKGEISAIPINYKGTNSDSSAFLNYNERMAISDLPQCSFTVDTYRAWLAQNKGERLYAYGRESIALGADAILLAATAGTSAAVTAPLVSGSLGGSYANQGGVYNQSSISFAPQATTGILGHVDNICTMLARQYDAWRMPNKARGVVTQSLSLGTNTLNFRAYNARIKPEYASILDDFFDLFGYATHRLKIPNISSRPTWNYTKTRGCRITPINRGIPADVDDAIRKIYDNGIRFWKDPAKIGNYTYSNAPTVVTP